VNASQIAIDFEWLRSHLPGSATGAKADGVQLENQSDHYAAVAIQGPKVGELFCALFDRGTEMPARNQIAQFDLGATRLWIARTGYTGEDGIEAFFPSADGPQIWKEILEKGKSLGIRPCGLGARDTLRLEMCYPLNGSDLSPEHNPLEAGLGFFVDLTKRDFVGRETLLRQKKEGLPRRLIPFRMKGKSPPPRPHYRVFREGTEAGELTSGTLSPSLNYGIGMAYLTTPVPKPGEEIEIEIRGQKFPAVIEKKPLYKNHERSR
jgi:aminomethyltransferase